MTFTDCLVCMVLCVVCLFLFDGVVAVGYCFLLVTRVILLFCCIGWCVVTFCLFVLDLLDYYVCV